MHRQPRHDRLEHDVRNANVHHAARFTNLRVERNDDNGVIRRNHAQKLRIDFKIDKQRIDLSHRLPRITPVDKCFVKQIGHDARFDLRQLIHFVHANAASAHHPIQHGIGDIRVDFQKHVAIQRRHLEDVDYRHLRNGADELFVWDLIGRSDRNLHIRAQLGGKNVVNRRAKFS